MKIVKNEKDMVIEAEFNWKEALDHFESKDKGIKYEGNKALYTEQASDESSSWRGGTVKELREVPRFNNFVKTRVDISKRPMFKKIEHKMGLSPKRKRFMSEHDGEMNFDKLYDIKLFESTMRSQTHSKKLNVVVDFSILAHTDAKDIDRYGATVWAIIQLLEAKGYGVNLLLEQTGRNVYCGNGASYRLKMLQKVKKENEYLSPKVLAMCFQSNWYRRVTFGMMVKCGDEFSFPVNSSLGTTWNKRQTSLKNGEFYISMPGYFGDGDVDKLLKHLENL